MTSITRIACIIGIITSIASGVFAQGSLTPTTSPAANMKTLPQIEPRTPISTIPYTIRTSGSYYLTSNLVSTGSGIMIYTNNVTIDLNGCTLTGDRGLYDYGIFISGISNAVLHNIRIKNGTIENFGYGIRLNYAENNSFENLTIYNNAYDGVLLDGSFGYCYGNRLINCKILDNNFYGIELNGYEGQCNMNYIKDCKIINNTSHGVYIKGTYNGQANGNIIRNCSINNNDMGIMLVSISGKINANLITDSTVNNNSSEGIFLDGESDGQCNGNTIRKCIVSHNSSHGIRLSGYLGQCNANVITECNVNNNVSFGVRLYGFKGECDNNLIKNNNITDTAGAASYGLYAAYTYNNIIVRNTSMGQTNNYSISAYDTYGPTVSGTGMMATNGAAMNPWANLSR